MIAIAYIYIESTGEKKHKKKTKTFGTSPGILIFSPPGRRQGASTISRECARPKRRVAEESVDVWVVIFFFLCVCVLLMCFCFFSIKLIYFYRGFYGKGCPWPATSNSWRLKSPRSEEAQWQNWLSDQCFSFLHPKHPGLWTFLPVNRVLRFAASPIFPFWRGVLLIGCVLLVVCGLLVVLIVLLFMVLTWTFFGGWEGQTFYGFVFPTQAPCSWLRPARKFEAGGVTCWSWQESVLSTFFLVLFMDNFYFQPF